MAAVAEVAEVVGVEGVVDARAAQNPAQNPAQNREQKPARSDVVVSMGAGMSALKRLRGQVVSRFGLIVLSACGLLLGCGKKADQHRVAVDGSIISSDKLLPNGTIRFLPEQGNNGPVAVTTVSGGLYRFTNADGPYPGKYRAVVNLELDYSALAKMSSTSSESPRMNWEAAAIVPDKARATLHFDWPDMNSAAESKTKN